jgi:hypothetical protein
MLASSVKKISQWVKEVFMSIKSNKKHDIKKKNIQKMRRRIHDNMYKPDFDDPFMEPMIIIEDKEIDRGIAGKDFKVSQVLVDFCRPWIGEFVEDNEGMEQLFEFAVVAWNQDYIKGIEKIEYLKSFLKDYEYSEKWVDILADLMERRETIFSGYRFFIVDNKVTFTEKGISLSTRAAMLKSDLEGGDDVDKLE